jgi:hypothetical protein
MEGGTFEGFVEADVERYLVMFANGAEDRCGIVSGVSDRTYDQSIASTHMPCRGLRQKLGTYSRDALPKTVDTPRSLILG